MNGSTAFGVRNDGGGTVNIIGGIINALSTGSTFGVYNSSGIINIAESVINSNSERGSAVGIHNGYDEIINLTSGTINSISKGEESYGIENESRRNNKYRNKRG